MKKTLLFLLTFITLHSENLDYTLSEWWVEDKQQHFNYSLLISSSIYGLAKHNDASDLVASVISIGSTVVIGWVKEQIDGFGNGTKEISDVDADALGAIAGTVITLFVYRIEF